MNRLINKYSLLIFFAVIAIILFTVSFAYGEGQKKTLDDFKYSTMGVVTGTVQETTALKNYPDANLKRYQTIADVGLAVNDGKIDCGLANEHMAAPILRQYNQLEVCDDKFYEGDTGFGFPKGSKFVAEFNDFIALYKDSDDYKRISYKWFDDENDSHRELDKDEFSGENGTINAYTSATMEPYEYYKGNEIVGFDTELFRKFCLDKGYNYTLTDVNFDSIIMSLTTGKADMATCALVETPERAQSIDFSVPVLVVNSVVMYKDPTKVSQVNFIDYLKDEFEKTFIKENRWQLIVEGLLATLVITLMAAIIATLLGFAIALFRLKGNRVLNKFLEWYIKLFQGIPVLVVLMIFYYIIFGTSSINAIVIAGIVFGLDSAAYVSEAVKSGIESVDLGQEEAALALGFTKRQAFFKFILPQAAKNFLPTYRGNIISMLKGTSVVGYIAIQDLTKAGDIIRSRTYDALFPLITVAIVYFIISWIINKLLQLLEHKISNKK